MIALQPQSTSRRMAAPVHKADAYFAKRFWSARGHGGSEVVAEAHAMRHRFPDLSGPELVRLAYWGASGAVS